ncbi:MAG: alpha-galactosidase, partial [Acidobacteriota bacterium]
MRCLKIVLLLAGLALLPAQVILHGDGQLVQVGDAFVDHDDAGWTIGNSVIRYSIGETGDGIGIRSIADPQGRDWHRSTASDNSVQINNQTVSIGSAATPFLDAEAGEWWGGVKLDVRYQLPSAGLEITRSYACYPGSSVIETWTTFTVRGTRAVILSDLNDYAFSIQDGTLNWITGLNVPDEEGGPFSKLSGDLDDGQVFTLGSDTRASETAMPWFSVRAPEGDEFFGSVLWSGSWRFRIERHGDIDKLQVGLPSFHTTLAAGAVLEAPHAIFGLTSAAVPDTSLALKNFIALGLRHGRPLHSYVTYNTWYSYGTFINQGSVAAEMDLAAAAGVEQFVIDAGWWFHINPLDAGDFKKTWGSWLVDPERFPDGLGALSDHAHALGMRFGVWVEPERVDRATVGLPGLARERFLATSGGRYNPNVPNAEADDAQVCLVDPEARAWVMSKLVGFIEEARPDYLKWDNNFWLNCDR